MEQPIAGGSLSQNDGARYDAFISYHWRDRVQIEDLARALRDRDLNVFLDRWYLRPGRPWPQELEEVLRGCRAVVVCVGAGEMGPWQQREAYVALERQGREPGFPVIPVLLQGAEPALGFLGQNTWVDLRNAPGDPPLLEILAAAIRGERPDLEARDRVARTLATVCPYRGLLYFREEDAPFFCGREGAIAGLIEAVQRGPLVAVVGASGSGKSSVVRAGLVPALRRDGARVWDAVTIVPGARPLHALAAGLLPLLVEPDMSEIDRLIEVNKLAGALETGAVHLPEIAARIVAKQVGTDRLLLLVDHWEELYTLTPDDAVRRRFVDELLEATIASPLTVVLTLRGDFMGHVVAYRSLADRLQGGQVNLGPMVRDELRRAIEQPAAKVGLHFEAGLVDRILDDAGDEPGNLPLLEFILRQLWEQRQHSELGHEAYRDLGRLPGAVAKKADEVFERLSALEQLEVQRVFLQLATPTKEGDYARRRVTRSELGTGTLDVVRKLADERLLVTAPGAAGAEETVEVSHEALLWRWERLKTWLDGHREFLLWRRRFAELVATWRAGGKGDDALAMGVFLGEAERWRQEQGEQLTPEEREYISASLDRRRRETEAEQVRVARELALAEGRALAQRRATRWALAGAVLFLCLAVVLAVLAIGPMKREWARHTLKRDLTWTTIPAPPGGVFLMGCVSKDSVCNGKADSNEKPRHPVKLPQAFELMKRPVTVAEFRRFTEVSGIRPSRQPRGNPDDSPVVNVSWDESRAFCELVDGRLPTEAEWEYAGRGGQPDWIYPWGDERPPERTEAIRENGFKLYDMAGSVYQWTSTAYRKYPYDADSERESPSSDAARVVRGGSFFLLNPRLLRVSLRNDHPPDDRNLSLGFRCARETFPVTLFPLSLEVSATSANDVAI